MKQSSKSSIRTVVSSREVLALATIFSVAHAAAAEAPKKEDTAKKDKKKGEESGTLDEITVTAAQAPGYKTEKLSSQKYVVPLRDVPQSVIVVPKKVVEQQGATTLTEVLRNVPGITMNAGENGIGNVAGETFFLRGFDGTNSIFLDGVRDDGLASRDNFNVENVEVFLGPTGADVGRGNASGYVNQSTKSPHLDNVYQGSTAYSSGDKIRLTGDLNQELPIDAAAGSFLDGSAIRLNGLYQYGGVAGRDFIERNTWGIAPSIALGLDTPTRLFFQYQHIEQDNVPDNGLPGDEGKLPSGVDRDWFYGNTETDFEDITQDTFTLRLEHDINDNITIRNQTRYNEADRVSVSTRPAYVAATNSVTRSMVGGDRENSIFSNQTSITAKFDTGIFKHSVVGGIEYSAEEQDTYTLTGLGSYSEVLPAGSPPGGRPADYDPHRDPFAMNHGKTDTLGIYVGDTVEITPQWLVTGNIRMDKYETNYHTVSNANVRAAFDTAEDDIYSGKLGVTYKPIEAVSVYGGYSRSVTPPGSAAFTLNAGATNANNPNNDPQESQNFELGVKWDINENLLFNSAVFYTENTNVIYQTNPGVSVGNEEYSVDGGQQVLGMNVGVAGNITENWEVIANASWLDATVDQPGAVADGRDVARTPHYSLSLWTSYKLPKGFTIGGGYRWTDTVMTSTALTAYEIEGYGVFDAMLQYDVNANMNVRLNVFNVMDEEYEVSTGGSGGAARINLGPPTSFMLSTNFKF